MNKFFNGLLISTFILFCCTQQAFSQEETGLASWYGPGFHTNTTAGGERFDMNKLTAAHPTLPFDTHVRVTNLKNKKSVVVRINDRGPFVKNRIIDVSREAARRLDILHSGVARVRVEVVNTGIAESIRVAPSPDTIPKKRFGVPLGVTRPELSVSLSKLNRDFSYAAAGSFNID